MRIAVLMSTYNGAEYLREQIDSILAQTGEFSLDLLVRDDGSQDGTCSILKQYADDGKLRFYTGNTLGPSHSFLDLLKHSEGYDFYAFSDQDDYWYPDKLITGINMLSQKGNVIGLYHCNAECVDAKLKSLRKVLHRNSPRMNFESLVCGGGIAGCMMVFTAGLAKLIQNAKMPDCIILHDYYLAIVCAAFDGTMMYDARPHMKYRQHGGNCYGVPCGLRQTIKRRIHLISKPRHASIADQAATVLYQYGERIDIQKRQWLEKVSEYQKTLFSRLSLACSCKVHYATVNMGLTLRIATLMGSR